MVVRRTKKKGEARSGTPRKASRKKTGTGKSGKSGPRAKAKAKSAAPKRKPARPSARKTRPKAKAGSKAKAKAKTKAKARSATPANGAPARKGNGSPSGPPLRDEQLCRVDEACAAWAMIVTERMAADESFAEVYERFARRPGDLRGLFVWDALLANEARVRLINDVLRRHIDGDRRADPVLVLAELRVEQQRLASAYAVNAFMAVLNNMRPEKPRWQQMEDFDSAFAVLALAHQALEYALDVARVEAPADLMDPMLKATQHESVWAERREEQLGSLTLAACAATAEFFRALGSERLTQMKEVARLYAEHAESAEVRAEARRERALAAALSLSI